MGNKKVIIAGGGTGGHIFPAIAIANAFRKLEPSTEILFVGAKGKMEMEKVPQAGYKIKGLDIAGFNRSSLIRNISLPFKLVRSFWQVMRIVSGFKPDAVVGVGGYSSFPVLRYAQLKGIPTFVHESNSFAGKANVMLGKKATKVFVAEQEMGKFFPYEKIILTGNPVRASIVSSNVSHEEGARFFGLDPAKTVVLATGGSLGAKGINEAIDAKLDMFIERGVQLIWQTGKPFEARAAEIAKGKPGIWTGAFITDMEKAYAAADIVISRAGAMAIAELCVVKKPVIFVPYPFAAEDHQTVNANRMVEKSAGLIVRDREAKEMLVPVAVELANSPEMQERLKSHISKLSITDADERIAKEILKVIS
ncbi:MAG TPA: undecaprenyldiphospho-muramoylpentapeptide beta-N-acetylglucosaminyltransferase [Chitinophagaceae bacterium]|nr:undecaprenyldiphospho-muramoylpentapeptide beta-N-acetylglucosaminyltransferase [Chitinophagaceae bacterium]